MKETPPEVELGAVGPIVFAGEPVVPPLVHHSDLATSYCTA
jgi:hypothetical protein